MKPLYSQRSTPQGEEFPIYGLEPPCNRAILQSPETAEEPWILWRHDGFHTWEGTEYVTRGAALQAIEDDNEWANCP